jgi:hypothetical protein
MNSVEDMTDSERQVAEYLKELDLWWWYQHLVFMYDEKKRPRVWTPDFYIPKLGMFIETCGKEREDYKYRKRIYRKNEVHVIFLQMYKGPKKWKKYLVKQIKKIEDFRHNEVMKMIDTLI